MTTVSTMLAFEIHYSVEVDLDHLTTLLQVLDSITADTTRFHVASAPLAGQCTHLLYPKNSR